jgi:hypothetical protein
VIKFALYDRLNRYLRKSTGEIGIGGLRVARPSRSLTTVRRSKRRARRRRVHRCSGCTRRTAARCARGRVLLSAALTLGWFIVRASPEEQALLEAHGFGDGARTATKPIRNPSSEQAGSLTLENNV